MNENYKPQEIWSPQQRGKKITLVIRLPADVLDSLEYTHRLCNKPIDTLLEAVIREGDRGYLAKLCYKAYIKDGWMSEKEFSKICRYVGDKYSRKVVLDPKRIGCTTAIYKLNDEEDN